MTNTRARNFILFAIFLLFTASCKKKNSPGNVRADESQGTYFSIRDFALDQWNNFRGSPFTVTKIIKSGGKQDSSIVAADTLEWGEIFKTFFATDISDKKYLGHYNFSSFSEDITGTKNYYYEAKDGSLFTRKLIISADAVNNRVLSIYIETAKNGGDGAVQKLYYSPMKLIQVQKAGSGNKNDVTEYRFMM